MGHKHAELMALYAQDAQETPEPWERWEFNSIGRINSIGRKWSQLTSSPTWVTSIQYRRKPKTLSVTLADGEVVSWPEPLNKLPEHDTQLWYLNGGSTYSCCNSHDNNYLLTDALKSGTLHLTEENAIQHIDALYKINNQHTRRLEWQ